MSIKYPCRECPNQYVKILYRGLVTVHVQCTACGFIMQVEKLRVKLLERQAEATVNCDHCHEPLGVSVVYDHGRRYHPPCYEPAFAKREAERKPTPSPYDCSVRRDKK